MADKINIMQSMIILVWITNTNKKIFFQLLLKFQGDQYGPFSLIAFTFISTILFSIET